MKDTVRFIRDLLLPYGTRRRDFVKKVYKKILKQQGIDENKAIYKETSGSKSLNYGLWDYKINKQLVILTTKHCLFIANLMKKCCKQAGLNAEVIIEKPQEGYKDLPHIVICPQMFKELPKLYVAFQMEQTVSSRWFTDEYYKKLKDSAAVFDYSLHNIAFLTKKSFDLKKLYYMPISYDKDMYRRYTNTDKQYDVLFYGDDSCLRRKAILESLSKQFDVKVINNLFGDDLYKELSKAKIIVNLHYYEGALLETTRIYECLSLNTAVIISEKSVDQNEHKDLEKLVDFVEIGDTNSLTKRIGYYLSNDENINKKLLSNKNILADKDATSFEYYFFRFLLASDNLTFDDFYDKASSYIHFTNNFWCLGLPEYIERRESFNSSNNCSITYYPGIRHYIGWIGCGMSYKFLMRKAKELNLPYVMICEDDVLFSKNFKFSLKIVLEYLIEIHKKWDVFSGMIVDVNNEANISAVTEYKDLKLVELDKMVSMVFNIYNRTFLEQLEQWDSSNRDADTNTIDRYIENKCKLNIVTTVPFLVSCKDELNSTLWGFQNSQYGGMLKASNVKMLSKIEAYNNSLEQKV